MNDNGYIKNLHAFIFFTMAIMNLILAIKGGYTITFAIAPVIAFYLIGVIVLGFLARKKVQCSLKKHLIYSGVFMLLAAWVTGYTTQSANIYYLAATMPAITLVQYLDLEGYRIFIAILFAQYFVSFFVSESVFHSSISAVEKISYFMLYISAVTMMHFFAKLLNYRIKYITEQERSFADLQKVILAKCLDAKAATKSKSDFLSNMSHEIRTPLNAILGMNEMILRENRDDDIAKYAGNVDRSGQMLLALINDILDFSKIEAGNLELVMTDYNFHTVVRDVINMLESRIRQKELKLMVEVSASIPSVLYGDDIRIKQIITNIMTNAVKYTDKGSVLIKTDIESVLPDGKAMVRIMVQDTGQGMSEENVKQLFDSFSRFNMTKNRQIEGTGLGMTITKKLLDAMDGHIEVESELGLGTKFTVYIPQEVKDETPLGEFAMNKLDFSDKKKRADTKFVRPDLACLIVDDSRVNLAVAKGLLKYSKMQISTASSGQECINYLKDNKVDIILLDHMMPGMDGIETLKVIKNNHLCDEVPVIALTANAVGNAKDEYLKAGFDDYLSKPISADRLEETMKKWLGDKEVTS